MVPVTPPLRFFMQTTYNNQVAKTGDNPQFDNETPLLKNPGHAPDRLSHSCQQVTNVRKNTFTIIQKSRQTHRQDVKKSMSP